MGAFAAAEKPSIMPAGDKAASLQGRLNGRAAAVRRKSLATSIFGTCQNIGIMFR